MFNSPDAIEYVYMDKLPHEQCVAVVVSAIFADHCNTVESPEHEIIIKNGTMAKLVGAYFRRNTYQETYSPTTFHIYVPRAMINTRSTYHVKTQGHRRHCSLAEINSWSFIMPIIYKQ